jgi:hypothetical protein
MSFRIEIRRHREQEALFLEQQRMQQQQQFAPPQQQWGQPAPAFGAPPHHVGPRKVEGLYMSCLCGYSFGHNKLNNSGRFKHAHVFHHHGKYELRVPDQFFPGGEVQLSTHSILLLRFK